MGCPGRSSIFAMDGVSTHLDPNAIHHIRSVGAVAVVLPPYCPFRNPIEHIFGCVKWRCRRIRREAGDEELALGRAALGYSDRDCSRVFQRCGCLMTGGFDPAANYKRGYALRFEKGVVAASRA